MQIYTLLRAPIARVELESNYDRTLHLTEHTEPDTPRSRSTTCSHLTLNKCIVNICVQAITWLMVGHNVYMLAYRKCTLSANLRIDVLWLSYCWRARAVPLDRFVKRSFFIDRNAHLRVNCAKRHHHGPGQEAALCGLTNAEGRRRLVSVLAPSLNCQRM